MSDILNFHLEAVAAVDDNWGIGHDGKLLAYVSPDLKHFKELTYGQRVIYGRHTLATFPKGKALPGRENVLLTHDASFEQENITVVHSLHELAEYLKSRDDGLTDFVIGGSTVYGELLPWCEKAHITRLYKTFPADRFFPDLDAHPGWRLLEAGEPQVWEDIEYSFRTYGRV